MADNKKYYYLKLKDNFYDSEGMILLQNMPDGYLYSDILMKLYLRSLKNGGKLMINDTIPYSPQMMAAITRHQVGTVEKALQIFKKLELIDVLDSGAIYMLDIQNFIGESSTEADRQRMYYNKIKEEKTLINKSENDGCKKPYKISTPEIEIEKEIEIELEIEKDIYSRAENKNFPYDKICEYLNNKINSNYKPTSKKTRDLIKARFNEGFTLEDFKTVIDKKVLDWSKDEKMSKFLRPETLFSNKFESYLNQTTTRKVTSNPFIEAMLGDSHE